MRGTLQDLCLAIVDCEHRTSPIDANGEYFAVGTPAMRGNWINYSQARRISVETFELWTRRMRPRSGDLLFAREAPVGPIVLIPEAENVAPGQRTVLLRPNTEKAEPRFLFYLLSSKIQQDRLLRMAAGSTVAHLNVADIRAFAVDTPELTEQRAIVEVLGSLDDKITANMRLTTTSEQLLDAEVHRSWLDDSVGSKVSILEVFEVGRSLAAPTQAEPVYLGMKNLPEAGVGISDWEHRAARGGARFTNGDTLLARITPCLENRKTGYVDFLESGEIGIGSTEFIVLRSRDGIPSALSYFLAVDSHFRDFAIRHMVGTSGRQRVSASDISTYMLPAPDQSWMRDFGARAAEQFELMKSLRGENRVLAALRDTLLPELMSGRLRVKDAEKKIEEVL